MSVHAFKIIIQNKCRINNNDDDDNNKIPSTGCSALLVCGVFMLPRRSESFSLFPVMKSSHTSKSRGSIQAQFYVLIKPAHLTCHPLLPPLILCREDHCF